MLFKFLKPWPHYTICIKSALSSVRAIWYWSKTQWIVITKVSQTLSCCTRSVLCQKCFHIATLQGACWGQPSHGCLSGSQPLGGTEVGYKLGLWRAFGGLPPLNLLLFSLCLLCAYCFSASLVLASNSWHDATTLPPQVALARLQLIAIGWL